MSKSITAIQAQTGDIVRFRFAHKSVIGTVLSRELDGTKVKLEIFDPTADCDEIFTLGASDHMVLIDR